MLSAIATAADRHATDEKIIASINKPQNALKGASASLFTTTAKKTDIKIKVRSKFRKTNWQETETATATATGGWLTGWAQVKLAENANVASVGKVADANCFVLTYTRYVLLW